MCGDQPCMRIYEADGEIYVHDPPDVERFSNELLAEADGQRLAYDGDTITITAANGTWTYRVTERAEHWVTARQEPPA